MRLALKLVSLVVLAIVGAIVFDGYLSFRRAVDLFDSDMRLHARLLGRSLEGLLAELWRSEGTGSALRLVEGLNRGEDLVRVRWVWLDGRAGAARGSGISPEGLAQLDGGEEVSFEATDGRGERHLLTYVPVPVPGGRKGALEISESASARDEYLHKTVVRTVVLTGSLILLSGLLTALLGVAMVGRPLRRLTWKARRIGAGDLSGPIRIRGGDELSNLAGTMNRMCEQLAEARGAIRAEAEARITVMDQLRHADRLKTVGTLAAGVAHELGTPLNVVSGRARLIASGELSKAEVADSADVVRAQCERMATIIRQLLDFSRPSSAKRGRVDLHRLAKRSVKLMAPMARKRKVTIHLDGEDVPATASANPGELQQVLTNLMVNALQAMPRGGTLEVGVRHEHARPPGDPGGPEGKWLRLWVRDQGEGIPEQIRDRLFEPFFTTKDVGEGTGLGLSIAHGIVRDHGGWIEVISEVGRGSCFSVYLPQGGGGCTGES